jgi:hypothetical protein
MRLVLFVHRDQLRKSQNRAMCGVTALQRIYLLILFLTVAMTEIFQVLTDLVDESKITGPPHSMMGLWDVMVRGVLIVHDLDLLGEGDG